MSVRSMNPDSNLGRRPHTWLRLLVVFVLATAVLAACGGDDEGADDGGGDTGGGSGTELSAVDNSFEPTEISAPAGEEVTVAFTNDGENPHTFSSADADFDSGTVDPGASTDVTFTMPDAETPFQCDIHGAAMSGTLVPEG
ncbi:MAG: cupredoxin domain-containing protein [Actinomycetota bacterium]